MKSSRSRSSRKSIVSGIERAVADSIRRFSSDDTFAAVAVSRAFLILSRSLRCDLGNGLRIVDPVAQAVGKDRVVGSCFSSFSLWDWEMLVGRRPVGQFGRDRFEVARTAQLFWTEALGALGASSPSILLSGITATL